MATVSARTATISSQLLSTSSVDDLLGRVVDAEEVTFNLNVSFRSDLLKIAMLAATLSRKERKINVSFAQGGASEGVKESLAQTLLGPMLGHVSKTRTGISSRELGFASRGYVDPVRKIFCRPTWLLDCESREGFLNDLSDHMRAAGIVTDKQVQQRGAQLAFEPNQNAEEHGSLRVGDSTSVFRCFVARVHTHPGPDLPATANEYIAKYHASGHTERTRWLELIVVDAGMGLAFPAYYVRARRMHSSHTDVYEADWHAEYGLFSHMLSRGVSTKGYWGTSLSGQTTVGEGHRLLLTNVFRLYGFAMVRAGRCLARVSWPHKREATMRETREAEYEVDKTEHKMFGGTAWHLLVPLDRQLILL